MQSSQFISNDIQQISNLFPTARFKRTTYPTRPFLTLLLTLGIAALGWFGVIPMGMGIFSGLALSFDDLIMSPHMRFLKSTDNLRNNRKKIKSITSLVAIALGLITGGLLFMLVFAHLPLFIAGLTAMIAKVGSPIVLCATGVMSAVVARLLRVNTFGIVFIGMLLTTLLPPIALPIFAEGLLSSVIVGMFTSMLISKQVLRAWYRVRHGHSNADSYEFNLAREETQKDRDIANKKVLGGMTAKTIHDLRVATLNAEQAIKKSYRFGTLSRLTDERTFQITPFKDIFYTLNHVESEEDKINLICLLQMAQEASRPDYHVDHYPLPWSKDSNLLQRKEYYRLGIFGALTKIPETIKTEFLSAIEISLTEMSNTNIGNRRGSQ